VGRSLKLRRIVFWLHLATGVSVGAVVFAMAATGVLLAAEKPLTAFAERGLRVAPPAPDAPRLDLDALVARAAGPDQKPDGATLLADPAAPVAVSFGRERSVFVNPYDGTVLGEGSAGLRRFFRGAENLHRWLAVPVERRSIGRAFTGACNAAFFCLALSGLFLWRPRRRTRAALRASLLPSLKGHGKARDWNWHNAVGFWSAPVLLLITSTGMVMSYPWANDLLYKAAGEAPPARAQKPAEGPRGGRDKRGRGADEGPAPAWEALASAARTRAPRWRTITLRLPPRGAPATAFIEEDGAPAFARSLLTLDAATAAVVKWEPTSDWSRGRRLRTWARFTHTGETGGAVGRLLAALASAGGMLLVWTGLSLALRRLRGARTRRTFVME
jgi:uncharacterized iron-regulated membrane protein